MTFGLVERLWAVVLHGLRVQANEPIKDVWSVQVRTCRFRLSMTFFLKPSSANLLYPKEVHAKRGGADLRYRQTACKGTLWGLCELRSIFMVSQQRRIV